MDMTKVNGRCIPTCATLGRMLMEMGDKPLFNGDGWVAVTGFADTKEGVQVQVSGCRPRGVTDKYAKRSGDPAETDR